MGKALFVTATDTGAGKTLVAGFIGRYFSELGISVATQKWVETGSRSGRSRDLSAHDQIMRRVSPGVLESARAPYVFRTACSPHLAARLERRRISPRVIGKALAALRAGHELVVVEGAGGALVPLNGRVLIAELARRFGLPALVVVNNKLGAINHALMTLESLKARGIPVLGTVFNAVARGDAVILRENPRIVARVSGVPVLGTLPFCDDPEEGYAWFRPIGKKIRRLLCVPGN